MDLAVPDWIFHNDVLMLAATADSTGALEITRSIGARRTGADRIRIYLPVPESLHFLNLAADLGRVSIVCGRPRDYRSIQLKAEGARPVATTAEDAAAVARYRAELGPALEGAGIPSEIWDQLISREVVTVEARLSSSWEQTPGANAGTRLDGGAG